MKIEFDNFELVRETGGPVVTFEGQPDGTLRKVSETDDPLHHKFNLKLLNGRETVLEITGGHSCVVHLVEHFKNLYPDWWNKAATHVCEDGQCKK